MARIIANQTKATFIDFSAVTSGIKEIRTVMQRAEENRRYGEKTIVFVDEIHRFNKAQQDAFLPFVEKGSIILIGATTENPSFEINGALLSRCKVFVLQALQPDELKALLQRALRDERGFGQQIVHIDDEMLEMIAVFANGDARTALSTLEMVILNGDMAEDGAVTVTTDTLEQCISKKSCSTIKMAKNTITSSAHCTNPCAIPTPTPLSIAGPYARGRRRSPLCRPPRHPFCQ